MKFFLNITIALLWLFTYGSDVSGPQASAQPSGDADYDRIDREYVLESTMIGYTGLEGRITGVLNPVLQAEPGEVVKITIINGELMLLYIVLENNGVSNVIMLE